MITRMDFPSRRRRFAQWTRKHRPALSTGSQFLRLAAAALSVCVCLPAFGQSFQIQELAPLPKGNICYGIAINDAGVVVGQSNDGLGGFPGAQWIGATPERLGGPAGWPAVLPTAISNRGWIAGYASSACNVGQAFLLDDSGPTTLPPVPDKSFTGAFGFNESGIIVGSGSDSCSVPFGSVACQWEFIDGSWDIRILPPLPGDPEAEAWDVNESGVVVGWSGDTSVFPPRSRACRWENGIPSALSDLGGGYSIATGVNDLGHYVGVSSTTGGRYRAFYYDGAQVRDLGARSPFPHSLAYRVNNEGMVIGAGYGGSPYYPLFFPRDDTRALVWRDGVMSIVNDLIPPASGWDVKGCGGINGAGQITGSGRYNGQWRAFRLTPTCPADFNNSGTLDSQDFFDYLAAFFARTANADFNHDQVVNSQDFFDFLLAFFAGC